MGAAKDPENIQVLHVGNIANNAWQNAKLMDQREGWENTVLSIEYYHCMGTPEWEEADFDAGQIEDDFFPEWWRIDLHGYERPERFIQGKFRTAIRYLLSKGEARSHLRRRLNSENRTEQDKSGKGDSRRIMAYVRAAVRKGMRLARNAVFFGCRFAVEFPVRIWKGIRHGSLPYSAAIDQRISASPFLRSARARLWSVSFGIPHKIAVQQLDLVGDFARRFPARKELTISELARWCRMAVEMRPVFDQYDVVQCYATDPIFPMLCGNRYFAFEHGTIRDIPFEDTARGRLTSLAYARAEHIFVTNSDCVEKARELTGGDESKFSFINHPFDENDIPNGEDAAQLREELRKELSADHLIFFPTRHDWVEGKGYNDKANDHLLNAVADLVAEDGLKIGLVLCDWGHNQQESRDLIRRSGLETNTKWIAPQATKRFMIYSMACDVVADQFKLGSFGGILFKAMAAKAVICTYLEEAEILKIYPEVPPVINARTPDEIRGALGGALGNKGMLVEIGERGRRWVETYHAGSETVRIQFEKYESYLDEIDHRDGRAA